MFGWALVCLLTGLVTASDGVAGAQRSSHAFAGHSFSLQLPPGYLLEAEQSPRPEFKTFAFSPNSRSDGTRALVQVSLFDLSLAPAGETVSLERFAAVMINGVRQRRNGWEQTEGDVEIDGVRAKRIEWTGSTEPGFGRPTVHMRGVMIAGIKKDLGFSLHTQDFVAFAETALPLGEQALQTFALTLRR